MSTETTELTDQTATAAPAEETGELRPVPISRAVLALHNLAAKDDSRPLLATIWSRGGRFTTADGFIGGMVKPKEENAPPDDLVIPRAVARSAVAKTSAKKRAAWIEQTGQGGEIVSEAKPHERVTYTTPADLSTNLDLAALRHTDAPLAATAFNIENVKKIATFFSTAMAGTDGIVELRVWGPSKALEFRARSAEGEELTAIMMPMVIGGYGDSGPWLFDPVAGVPDRAKLLDHHIKQTLEGGQIGPFDDKVASVANHLSRLGFSPEVIEQVTTLVEADAKRAAYEEVCGAPAEEPEPEATAAD